MARSQHKQKSDHRKSRTINLLTYGVLIAIIAACSWYLYYYFTTGSEAAIPLAPTSESSSNSLVDETAVPPVKVAEYTVPAANPRYLSIPGLGINKVRVMNVGLKDNMIDSPTNINDVAWYRGSAKPGSGGAILIDGHNGGTRKDGVFVNLGKLQPGDAITLERGDGQIFTYSVVENSSVPIAEVNATGMKKMLETAQAGKEALNLITCDGVYDKSVKQFNRRIMLRAVLAS